MKADTASKAMIFKMVLDWYKDLSDSHSSCFELIMADALIIHFSWQLKSDLSYPGKENPSSPVLPWVFPVGMDVESN